MRCGTVPAVISIESKMPTSLVFRPAAYILAGGKSSRFGSDKARVRIHGQPNLSRLASAMSESGWSVTAVAQEAGAYEDLGLRTIADFEPHAGPLAGVITALEDFRDRGRANPQATGSSSTAQRELASCEWALIVNCDLILWRAAWSQALLRGTAPGAWITLLSSTDFVPFPGLYSPALLPSARERWRAGTRSMKGLFEVVADRWSGVDGQQAAEADAKTDRGELQLPWSYNTPDELERALAALESGRNQWHG
jgi:molybdenum cofactor guanylyltransferase